VAAIQNQPVSSTAPAEGDTLRFTGGKWTPTPKPIFCTASWTGAGSTTGHTFIASECGGTLPDATYYAVPLSWGGCDGFITVTTYQGGDANYPGMTGFLGNGGSGCGSSSFGFTALYIKK
jgi:hypothetical protein